MIWVLLTVVAVLLVGVFAAMLAGWVRYDPMTDPVTSQPDAGLDDGFAATDVAAVHFDTALRGYRMDQVDDVLDRLQERLAEQERELATLRGARGAQDVRRVADAPAAEARPVAVADSRSGAPEPTGWPGSAAGGRDPQGTV